MPYLARSLPFPVLRAVRRGIPRTIPYIVALLLASFTSHAKAQPETVVPSDPDDDAIQPEEALQRILVVPTERPGADHEAAEAAAEAMTAAFEAQGITLVQSEDSVCLDDAATDACESLLARHECDAVLVVTVDPATETRPSPVLSIDLFDNHGAELGLSRAFTAEPSLVAAGLVEEALTEWQNAQPVQWRIEGTPEGAAVQVDRSIGRLPYLTTVRAGEHTLTVRAPGHRTYQETVIVESGQADMVTTIALDRDDGQSQTDSRRRTPWQRIVGPVMVGAGVVGAGSVIGFTVASTGCNSAETDGRCVSKEEIAWGPTLAYAGVGVAVAVAGAIIWLTAPDADTQVAIGAGTVDVRHSF